MQEITVMTTPPFTRSADADELPQVTIRKRRGPSVVWLVPLIAGAIAIWLGVVTLREEGPTVTIKFDTAEGLEAGKTKVKYKDVEIGTVEEIRLNDDFQGIVAVAKMTKQADAFMTAGTRFWVVRPRVGLSGVTGLGTLLSGAYIGLDPGKGSHTTTFTGLKEPPPIASDVPGRKFVLQAETLGSIGQGAPIYYNGLRVGQVLSYELNPNHQGFTIPIFVNAPYDTMVRSGSRFWNVSGVDMSISAEGVQVSLESLPALLTGGVAFDTPGIEATAEPAPAETSFALFPSKRAVEESVYTRKVPYIAYFEGSVGGLRQGAPVEFRGIKIGQVTDVRLMLDPKTFTARIPVTFELEPDRVQLTAGAQQPAPYVGMAALIRHGLRAQLQSGNLLTGELVVALDLHPEAPPAELRMGGTYPEIPTMPTDIEQITRSVNQVLDKFANAHIPELVDELRAVVNGLNGLISSPDTTGTLAALRQSAESLQQVVNTANTQFGPLAESLRRTADTANTTLSSVDEAIGRDSRLHYDLAAALKELATASRSIRVFADYLERHPEALIRGKAGPAQ
jgi:paraquat-inducible protein B